MSENITKSELLVEKTALAKELRVDIKEMRSANNYDGLDFALTELKRLNRLIKSLSK